MIHEGVDFPHRFPDVAERVAANRLLGDKCEPALTCHSHRVQNPRSGGKKRGEVEQTSEVGAVELPRMGNCWECHPDRSAQRHAD
jgi:hypothetical protein